MNQTEAKDLIALLNAVDDLLFVLNPDGSFRSFFQPANHADLYRSPDEFIGKPYADVLPPAAAAQFHEALARIAASREREELDYTLDVHGEQQCFNARLSPIEDEQRQLCGVAAVVRNVTARRRWEREREQLIGQLQDALSKVKTLRGLIPICASCKKVRDDRGYWGSVEAYVRDRSEADFTHGVCPSCAEQLYPDVDPANPDESA